MNKEIMEFVEECDPLSGKENIGDLEIILWRNKLEENHIMEYITICPAEEITGTF